ncbi:MAG TPA: MarR family winged helix-turn-helix transcriptional regulator [Chitinivibrionales bacterium]|nr:MarR family winged helix-turn-helix transcriptional regulator [Chitinivibrionales bacterium]
MSILFRVKFAKGDQQFEAEGDKAFVLEMLKRFELGVKTQIREEDPKPGKAKMPQKPISVSGKQLSVGEFIRQTGAKKHTDVVLAFGYYLEKYSGVSEFSPADINSCYYEAKMEISNTSQMLFRDIKRGLIMESMNSKNKPKKLYTLTRTGLEYVEETLTKTNN